ncbi:sigma-70 family RNA polymerase sigma factor [Streptomyces cinnamoneus]|uniref:sigma-70 family RNA polymerase sigma factor n=1 Tax=Streptomyces cinnamoneus TaxID=53446 RepID=UPI003401299E
MGVDGREEPRGSDGTDEPPPLHKVPGQGGPPGLPVGPAAGVPAGPPDDPSAEGFGPDVGAGSGAESGLGLGAGFGTGFGADVSAGSSADSDPLELWSGAFGTGVPQPRDGGWLGGDPGPDSAAGTGAGTAGVSDGSDPCTGGSAPTGDADAQDDADAPPSDLELVTRLRGGESSDAYEELYRRHADAVRRYARTCCRDDHTAEDLTNEVFTSTLQAVRRGAGPDSAVRAYLLTTVRRVAAAWGKTTKREQLIEDFAVFATSAAAPSVAADDDTLGLGADVRAMQEAEESLAVQAFRSLPERWQTVLWHTTVEEESPSEVAPLLGLSANATAVLAHRAREGLKQAYLQAHVSSSLTSGGDCARYADRLGAYARGRLRTRAERGMRKHLEECARCRSAALEVADVNERLRAVLPVAVIGWFAAGWSVKAVAGLAAGAGTAAGAAAGAGAAVGGGSGGGGVGAPGTAGASAGSGSSTASGSSAASGPAGLGGEGLGVPAKIGLAAGALAAAGAVVAYALAAGAPAPAERPRAARTAVAPVVPAPPAKPKPSLTASPAPTLPPSLMAKAAATPSPEETSPSASPVSPSPASPTPEASRTPAPGSAAPLPAPSPAPATFRPKPTPPPRPPARPSAVFPLNELEYGGVGDGREPEVRLGPSSWLWQRYGMRVGGAAYRHGVSVHASSSVTIDLNRSCTSYDALVGVDDMTLGLGTVTFSVFADGARLWSSGPVRAGVPAVAVHAPLAGHKTLRLAVAPVSPADRVAVADWAMARISCDVGNKPPVAGP